ncbi:hypothetical protein J6590_013702 [Homalodisca vitripennis]|nr:hypothetical protein J6590_013702 [Homalodisca vitripennis]
MTHAAGGVGVGLEVGRAGTRSRNLTLDQILEESELDNCDSMNESDAQTEYSDHNTNTDQSDCESVLRQEDTVQMEIEHSQAATAPLASSSNIQYVQGPLSLCIM